MKMIVAVALALVAVSHAASIPEEIPIIRSDFASQPDGAYKLDLETGNGIIRSEVGELKQALDAENKPHEVVVVRGFYSYPREDGKVETINFFADENGYHAEGESIPKVASR